MNADTLHRMAEIGRELRQTQPRLMFHVMASLGMGIEPHSIERFATRKAAEAFVAEQGPMLPFMLEVQWQEQCFPNPEYEVFRAACIEAAEDADERG